MEVIREMVLTGPLFAAAALSAVSTAHGSAAADRANVPRLIVPMACDVGKTCLIQKLVDHDSGPGRRDHRCGTLTTDGHDGIDEVIENWQFMQILGRLPSDEAELLRFRFQGELSQSEIAARTGIPLGTVKSRMVSALTRLRGMMEAES